MKAKIFYINSQEQLSICKKIETALKEILYKSIYIERIQIPSDYFANSSYIEHNFFEDYQQLLKRAMLKPSDFTIIIEKDDGGWSYSGYGHSGKNAPFYNFLNINQSYLPRIFPAVAILDRLMLLPYGMNDVFEAHPDRFKWLLRPYDSQGVLLIDFSDENQIFESIKWVTSKTKKEIENYFSRQMLMRRYPQPDFDELSYLLGVETNFLREVESEIKVNLAEISASVTTPPIPVGKTSKVKITINKKSESFEGSIYMRIKAPSSIMKNSVKKTFYFERGTFNVDIEFDITPNTYPYLPIEILFGGNEMTKDVYPLKIPAIIEVFAN